MDHTVVVQDDSREKQIAEWCGLKRNPLGRSNCNLPDAFDVDKNHFELKSATRGSVTTARDVGPHTLREWERRYWIFAFGDNLGTGFKIRELYIASPDDLRPFFKKLNAGFAEKWKRCEEVLGVARRAGASTEALETAAAIMNRGITQNNPHISRSVIVKNGTRISEANPTQARAQIREFVKNHPLRPTAS